MSSDVAELERVTAGLPDGWASGPVLDFFQLQRGHDLPVHDRKSGSVPIIASNGPVGWHDHSPITGPGVITGRSGTIGNVNYVEGSYWPLNTTLYVRDFKGSDPRFIYYFLQNFPLTDHQSGTGVPTLNRNDVHAVWTAFPPLDEQRRIAEVLRSVDDAIAATQAAYDGTVSTQAAVFETFLQSGNRISGGVPIKGWTTGKINGVNQLPAGWRVVRLVDVARLESGHTPDRKKPEYWDGGSVEWISLHDTQNLERCDISHTEMRITAAGLANSSARLLPAGTVCFSRTATVGKCVIMAKSMATSQDFANFVCSPELNNRYLLHLMRWMQPVWKALASGSTHKTIYMPTFKALQIILPSRSEQDEIAATMDSFVNTAEGHAASLAHLRSLKSSLMSDLLAGRVRVPA